MREGGMLQSLSRRTLRKSPSQDYKQDCTRIMQTRTFSKKLQPSRIPNDQARLAYSGFVYVHQKVYNEFYRVNGEKERVLVKLMGQVFTMQAGSNINEGEVALNKFQREFLRVSLMDLQDVSLYQTASNQEHRLASMTFDVQVAQQVTPKLEIEGEKLQNELKAFFKGFFFNNHQQLLYDYQGNALLLRVQKLSLMETGYGAVGGEGGVIGEQSDLELQAKSTQTFKLKQGGQRMKNIFTSDFKFEDIGIGGLDNELSNIFRRAFASRRFPAETLEKYGIKHIKGVIMYGPPGTGKTLIAKQLAKVLRCQEPKIVNGPEIMSKYVGETEKNIRELFEDAVQEQKEQGDESQLHIIIFDEIDAICKQRGSVSSGTGVHDSMVNQLLSMIDGVNALNNVLVIGMTNRLDLIDDALLRPGRFEVHIEVSLPDEKGRADIFKIHTAQMFKNELVSSQVSIDSLAKQTKNYTGAEIEGLVKSAASFSLNRANNLFDLQARAEINKDAKIEPGDFEQAMQEVKPQFGIDSEELENLQGQTLMDYGATHRRNETLLRSAVDQVKNSTSSQLHSVLLEGPLGSGKTALAAHTALHCGFPFVKLITPEKYVGMNENQKVQAIVKVFMDAYRSPLACIIIDNLERLIEYISQGPRFSNNLLQTLLVLIKKQPKGQKTKLLIIGTTSLKSQLRHLELISVFNLVIKVPSLKGQNDISNVLLRYTQDQLFVQKVVQNVKSISIKKLLFVIEMSQQGNKSLDIARFMECYEASSQNESDDEYDVSTMPI